MITALESTVHVRICVCLSLPLAAMVLQGCPVWTFILTLLPSPAWPLSLLIVLGSSDMRCSHEDALREFSRWHSHLTPTFPLVLKGTFTLLGDSAAHQILNKSALKSDSVLLITRQPGEISDASEFYPAKLLLEALHTERQCPWKTHTCLFRCTKTEVDHLQSEEAESSPCVFVCSLFSSFLSAWSQCSYFQLSVTTLPTSAMTARYMTAVHIQAPIGIDNIWYPVP